MNFLTLRYSRRSIWPRFLKSPSPNSSELWSRVGGRDYS